MCLLALKMRNLVLGNGTEIIETGGFVPPAGCTLKKSLVVDRFLRAIAPQLTLPITERTFLPVIQLTQRRRSLLGLVYKDRLYSSSRKRSISIRACFKILARVERLTDL